MFIWKYTKATHTSQGKSSIKAFYLPYSLHEPTYQRQCVQ